jgi:hypothetical protein
VSFHLVQTLLRNRISMADKKRTLLKIQAALKGHKGIVTNVDEFHDRFYLIRYLWACFKDIDNDNFRIHGSL